MSAAAFGDTLLHVAKRLALKMSLGVPAPILISLYS